MATAAVGDQSWNANYVEDQIIRQEHQTVEGIWISHFNKDFRSYLETSEVFCNFISGDFIRTNYRAILLDCRDFREFVDRRIETSWIEAHRRRQGATSGSTGDAAEPPVPPIPTKTPINCAWKYLELYFFRIIPQLKVEIVASVRSFSRSEAGIAAIPDPDARDRLHQLASIEGVDTSFELVPINPVLVKTIRALKSEDVGQLMTLTGVVTRCSEVKPELRLGCFRCQMCTREQGNIEQQFRLTEPARCNSRGCNNRTRWEIKLAKSLFGDWQKLRLQQASNDDLPAGSVPRTIDVIARSQAVEKCKPGDCIAASGYLTAAPDVPALMKPSDIPPDLRAERNRQGEQNMQESTIFGLKKLGIRELGHKCLFIAVDVRVSAGGGGDIVRSAVSASGGPQDDMLTATSAGGRLVHELMVLATEEVGVTQDAPSENAEGPRITEQNWRLQELLGHPLLATLGLVAEQHKRFKQIARSAGCLDKLAQWMAPEIYGSSEIKKGLMLMLVKGIEKRTRRDQIQLRGDINVCLVGDPGTAKSQFLKFIQGFADRAVFTSGKSSTAAGLTASIHKDPDQGESVVEAGALILADRGVCCIDEFDKMDEKDMVAIHEAMEQQTISISKAGIQATMNARASVLAACNPVAGRYDRSRRLIENLRLTSTVLSRFDLIFVILDQADEEEDRRVATHVLEGLDWIAEQPAPDEEARGVNQPAHFLRGALLNSTEELKQYIRIAKVFRPRLTPAAKNVLVKAYVAYRQQDCSERRSMRITVRQLESLIRLSEAVAKLHFSDMVSQHHAELAIRLFGGCLERVKTDPIALIESDEETEPNEAEADAEGAPRRTAEDSEKPRQALLIEADDFDMVQSQILEHLRRTNEKVLVQSDPLLATQILQQKERSAVIDWYLGEFHSDVVDANEIEAESRKVSLIVARMLKSGVLYEELLTTLEPQALDSQRSSGQMRVLQIHPNVDTSATRGSSLLELWSRRHRRQGVAAAVTVAGGSTLRPGVAVAGASVGPSPVVTSLPTSPSVGGGQALVAAKATDENLNLTDGDFLSMIYPS